MPRLEPLDWTVVAVYGAVVVAIGAWANRRQKNTEDYFLGGRRMRWWAVGVSLIATSFSSVALIGGTGYGYGKGMGYLQLQIGDFVAILVACMVFLPFFARLRLTTAYEYLELRFGVGARTVASALFLGQTLLRTGILVLGPALALTAVSDLDLQAAIVLSGVAALLYSAAGGITAVVWTDLIQLSVVVLGVLVSVVIVSSDVVGGAGAVWSHAAAEGRLEAVSTDLTFATPFTLVGALLAYGVLALSVAGTNQQAVQRYLACTDVHAARRAAFLGWGIGFFAVALTLFLGVAIHAWSDLSPAAERFTAAMAEEGRTNDSALPLFILHRLPAGISGLLVAAIFAASMSSMDSAIHSMSTATLVDFVRRFRARPMEARSELRLARLLTAVFGVLAILAALLAATAARGLLDTLITWLGYFAGPLLGLFGLGVLTRRTNEAGALIGTALGAGLVAGAVALELPARWAFHPLWLAPVALLTTLVGGFVAGLAFPPPQASQVEGLTLRSPGDRSGRRS